MMSDAAPLRRVEISREALAEHLTTRNAWEVVDGIPQDTDVVDAGYDPTDQLFYLTVEHRAWNLVGEGQTIPLLDTEIVARDATQLRGEADA